MRGAMLLAHTPRGFGVCALCGVVQGIFANAFIVGVHGGHELVIALVVGLMLGGGEGALVPLLFIFLL